jgi:hypothetical protein
MQKNSCQVRITQIYNALTIYYVYACVYYFVEILTLRTNFTVLLYFCAQQIAAQITAI